MWKEDCAGVKKEKSAISEGSRTSLPEEVGAEDNLTDSRNSYSVRRRLTVNRVTYPKGYERPAVTYLGAEHSRDESKSEVNG